MEIKDIDKLIEVKESEIKELMKLKSEINMKNVKYSRMDIILFEDTFYIIWGIDVDKFCNPLYCLTSLYKSRQKLNDAYEAIQDKKYGYFNCYSSHLVDAWAEKVGEVKVVFDKDYKVKGFKFVFNEMVFAEA